MDIDLTKTKITISNIGEEDIGFRYFRVNFTEVLHPDDIVILIAASSEEVAYYLAQANEKIGLLVEAEDAE